MIASSHLNRQDIDVGRAQLEGGLRVMSMDELREKRKKTGICQTCGETRTHKHGIWKSLMPDTIDGVVYKGICLKCSTLDAAKLNLGEPLVGFSVPDDMERSRKATCFSRRSSAPLEFVSRASFESQKAASLAQPQDLKCFPDARLKKAKKLDRSSKARSMPTIGPMHEAKAPEKARISRAVAAAGHLLLMPESRPYAISLQKFDNNMFQQTASPTSHEPFLLPDYSIGDMGCKVDMMDLTREEATKAVSLLHINDCAFIHRSDGTWSYATVKSRAVGQFPSITFQVTSQGSIKVIASKQWGGHVRPPRKPDTLPQYLAGDPGREEDMIIETSKKDTVKTVSLLRLGDAAFVKRSDGSWAYALVADRSGGEIKFEVNAQGSTKVITVLQSGNVVRRVKHNSSCCGCVA